MCGIKLEYEVADRITFENLKDYRSSLIVKCHEHMVLGDQMHPDDFDHSQKMIKALEFVMKDFEVPG